MRGLAELCRWGQVAVGGVVCVGLLIAAASLPAQARSLAEIQQTGEIRFCISDTDPAIAVAEPKGCREDCTFKGPVYDAALAFAATLGDGVKPTFLRVDWEEQFHNKDGKTDREGTYTPELRASGACDLYPSHLTKLPWRLKKLDFVILFPSRMMVLVNKRNKRKFRKPQDLAGKVAIVTKDSSFHTWLQEQNEGAYKDNPVKIEFISSADAVQAVDTGKVDFTLLDGDMAMYAAGSRFKKVALAFPVGPADEIGWAFRKDDKDLQESVRQYFETEQKAPYSETNKRWKKTYGLSLQDYIEMVTSLK